MVDRILESAGLVGVSGTSGQRLRHTVRTQEHGQGRASSTMRTGSTVRTGLVSRFGKRTVIVTVHLPTEAVSKHQPVASSCVTTAWQQPLTGIHKGGLASPDAVQDAAA
jgi:hypothetical protein